MNDCDWVGIYPRAVPSLPGLSHGRWRYISRDAVAVETAASAASGGNWSLRKVKTAIMHGRLAERGSEEAHRVARKFRGYVFAKLTCSHISNVFFLCYRCGLTRRGCPTTAAGLTSACTSATATACPTTKRACIFPRVTCRGGSSGRCYSSSSGLWARIRSVSDNDACYEEFIGV